MIRFNKVTKNFGDDSPALSDVTFEVDTGQLVVITGQSGSGKTTLMRLLTKEYEPTEGEIVFYDTSLNKIGSSQVHLHRRQIGVVFQDYRLLDDLNVWENIALALSIIGTPDHEIESRVTDLLRLVDIADKAYHFPAQLSGGEAQRVSIARALSTGPKVIFADEPTGNLDHKTTKNIVELLKKINDLGTTVMVTTHDPIVMEILKNGHHLELDGGLISKDSKPATSKKESKKKDSTTEKPAPDKPKEEPKKSSSKDHEDDQEKSEDKKSGSKFPSFTSGFSLPKFSFSLGKSQDEDQNSNQESESDSKEKTSTTSKKSEDNKKSSKDAKVKVEKL